MEIQYHCSRCGNDFSVTEIVAERDIRCTSCGAEGAYLAANTTPNPDHLMVGGLVVGSWRAFTANSGVMLAVAAVYILVLEFLCQISGARDPFSFGTSEITDADIGSVMTYFAISIVVGTLVGIPTMCVIYLRTLGYWCDRTPNLSQCLRASLRRLPAVFLVQFASGVLLTAMGVTVIGIPFAIFFLVAWTFGNITAFLTGGLNPFTMLAASREVVRGKWLLVFLVGVTVLVAALIVSSPYYFGLISPQDPSTIVASIFYGIVLVLVMGVLETVLYLQLRSDKEGLTKEQLAAEIDALLART